VPPAPPTPPAGSARPRADQFPQSVVPPPFEQTTQTTNESASHLEQEREAILRMIAQGRITAEEGDMLLEGLGS
jgi:hypothetical protein